MKKERNSDMEVVRLTEMVFSMWSYRDPNPFQLVITFVAVIHGSSQSVGFYGPGLEVENIILAYIPFEGLNSNEHT